MIAEMMANWCYALLSTCHFVKHLKFNLESSVSSFKLFKSVFDVLTQWQANKMASRQNGIFTNWQLGNVANIQNSK
jgi:hypothetical protein